MALGFGDRLSAGGGHRAPYLTSRQRSREHRAFAAAMVIRGAHKLVAVGPHRSQAGGSNFVLADAGRC